VSYLFSIVLLPILIGSALAGVALLWRGRQRAGEEPLPRSRLIHAAFGVAWRTPLGVVWFILTAWCTLAMGYGPLGPSAVTWSMGSAFALACLALAAGPMPRSARPRGVRWTLLMVLWASAMTWFWFVPAPADADWQPDVQETVTFAVSGNDVTVSGIRNFRYRSSDTDCEHIWVERTYDLTQLRTVDLFFSFWGPLRICHNFVSFGFQQADGTMKYLAVSIEARKRVGQAYSAVGGMFRQYTLIYVWADERDVVRVRTNFRGETIRRYRIECTPENARILFERFALQSIDVNHHPRWYNAITQSCGVDILRTALGQRIPLFPSPRLLLNGTWEEQAWRDGWMDSSTSLKALQQQADITADAKAAGMDDFSQAIRKRDVVIQVRDDADKVAAP